LRQTGRDEDRIALVEAYAKANGLWRDAAYEPVYTSTLSLDLCDVVPAISGPKRPQDHVALDAAAQTFKAYIEGLKPAPSVPKEQKFEMTEEGGAPSPSSDQIPGGNRGGAELFGAPVEGRDFTLNDGSVVIAAITSCTNTSNPYVLMAAGLVARKARALGLTRKPWVKTSLAPGSQVVAEYLDAAGLNSGPLEPEISKAIAENDLVAVSVLSGNRNFEGRISPDVRANYLASPPLVVAYAIAGDMNIDITREPIGQDKEGRDVFLKDIWPTSAEVSDLVHKVVTREMFQSKYADVFKGDERWQAVETTDSETYDWPATSTYIQNPPYFQGMNREPGVITDIEGARVLAVLYLTERQVAPADFNSYGSRRGNHEIMMRGTFANIRIKNEMLEGVEGGYTKGPDGDETSIYDAAMAYQQAGTPLVVVGGVEYGAGSSRDWAAKGTNLLGVKAVIAESFERIHRSNLVGMGVIPFEFT
ncbi:MAG: aconitate hydratase, partial [Pelagerythrobacter marensis]